MAVNWGLGAPVDLGGAFQSGWDRGREMRRERETDNALSMYAQNPDDPNAVNALLRVDPRLAMQLRQQQQKSTKEQKVRDLAIRAANGDHSVMPELLAEAPEIWTKLGAQQQDQVKRATSFMANAGLQIGQLPEDQRAAAWSQYVQQAESSGLDIPTQYERYTPQAFNAAMAEADKMGAFLDSQKIEWKSVPFGATFVPTNATTGERLDQGGPTPSVPAPSGPTTAPGSVGLSAGGRQVQRAVGGRPVPANANQILDEARAALAAGADPAAVEARVNQLLGIE